MNRDVNIYGDDGRGWTLEVLALGEWYVVGVFGSRDAAVERASRIR